MDYTTPMTDAERADRDRLLAEADDWIGREIEAKTEFGRRLREINDRHLYREHPETGESTTFSQFVRAKYDKSDSWAYQRIELANVADDLLAAGVDAPEAVSHVGHLVQIRHAVPETRVELRARAARRAAEIAGAAGRRTTEADIVAACADVRADLDAPETDPEPLAARDAARAAVRNHVGLLVALSVADVRSQEGVLGRIPSGTLVPYDDDLQWTGPAERAVDAVLFAREQFDDLTSNTWPVVVADPWTAATAWSLPDGPFHATFVPARLSSPRARLAREASDRDRTVLVAPGVDLLPPDVPERVVRAIIDAAGADTGRRYLVLTAHPDRAWDEWPDNVFVFVEAAGTVDAVVEAAEALRAVPGPTGLVVRGLTEAIATDALDGVDWVLVRGRGTRQEAYDSLRRAVGDDLLDQGSEVRARHAAYPPLRRAAPTQPNRTPRLPPSTTPAAA